MSEALIGSLAQTNLPSLVTHRTSILADVTVEVAHEAFQKGEIDFLAVVDGERLVGVCARRELAQILGSRFGYSIYARQPIIDHLMAAPLRVAVDAPITEVFKSVAGRSHGEFYDDVVLIDLSGRYLGMIPTWTLVRLQTETLLGIIEALELSRREIAEKRRQIDEDLAMAREVQLAMLPQTRLFNRGERTPLRLAHEFRAASGMSGDFFDVFRISENATGIFVCDVMGHGVRSALIAAMTRAMLVQLRWVAFDPAVLLTQLNRNLTSILRQTGDLIFVTAAYMVFDLERECVCYAQAGHPTPLRWEMASRRARPLACPAETAGPALGLIDEFAYRSSEESLAAGDRWLLFTDGVAEVISPGGEEFGMARLADALNGAADRPLEGALQTILGAVCTFGAESALDDDVCLVAAELSRMPLH